MQRNDCIHIYPVTKEAEAIMREKGCMYTDCPEYKTQVQARPVYVVAMKGRRENE